MMPFAGMHELIRRERSGERQERSNQLQSTILTLNHELRTRFALQDADEPVMTSATFEATKLKKNE